MTVSMDGAAVRRGFPGLSSQDRSTNYTVHRGERSNWADVIGISAPETRPLGRGGRRAPLRLDIALDGFKGCAARRSGEIRGRPEGALVIAASNIRPCLSQHSAGCALQNIYQSRDRHLRWIFDQHVNVIGFTVAGDQPAIHGLADLTEMPGKPVQCGAIEYAASDTW